MNDLETEATRQMPAAPAWEGRRAGRYAGGLRRALGRRGRRGRLSRAERHLSSRLGAWHRLGCAGSHRAA